MRRIYCTNCVQCTQHTVCIQFAYTVYNVCLAYIAYNVYLCAWYTSTTMYTSHKSIHCILHAVQTLYKHALHTMSKLCTPHTIYTVSTRNITHTLCAMCTLNGKSRGRAKRGRDSTSMMSTRIMAP